MYGERNFLTGNIVCADVMHVDGVDQNALRLKIKQHCAATLQPYMVPVRITFPKETFQTARFKRDEIGRPLAKRFRGRAGLQKVDQHRDDAERRNGKERVRRPESDALATRVSPILDQAKGGSAPAR